MNAPQCYRCGSKGGYANILRVYPDGQGYVSECDWCRVNVDYDVRVDNA